MTGIFITARAGSSRLQQKHLIPVLGKTMLHWLCARLTHEFSKEIASGEIKVVVATSEKDENKIFLEPARASGVDVFFGSDSNIPLRHLQCAERHNIDNIISVDGDDILCSFSAARSVFSAMMKDEGSDLFSTHGLPLGMNVSGYTTDYLRKSLSEHQYHKMETGWGRIFSQPKKHEIQLADYDIMGDLRFTLDYPKDAEFFTTVINSFGEKIITVSDSDLIDMVQQKKMYLINSHLKSEYWENFNREKEKEVSDN